MGKYTLPSVESAEMFWEGHPDRYQAIVGSVLKRSLLIGAGLFIAGERKHLIKYSLAASAFIQLSVLWEIKKQMEKKNDLP